MSAALDFSKLCMQCLRAPRLSDRRLCHSCKKQTQLERYHRLQRRKKLDAIDPERCNCNDPACKGFCNVVRL